MFDRHEFDRFVEACAGDSTPASGKGTQPLPVEPEHQAEPTHGVGL